MTIQKLTQHALLNIHNDLEEKNIYEKLDQSFMADANKNYNIMHQEIYDTIEKHTLKKIVKSNRHKHKISKWITHLYLYNTNSVCLCVCVCLSVCQV